MFAVRLIVPCRIQMPFTAGADRKKNERPVSPLVLRVTDFNFLYTNHRCEQLVL